LHRQAELGRVVVIHISKAARILPALVSLIEGILMRRLLAVLIAIAFAPGVHAGTQEIARAENALRVLKEIMMARINACRQT